MKSETGKVKKGIMNLRWKTFLKEFRYFGPAQSCQHCLRCHLFKHHVLTILMSLGDKKKEASMTIPSTPALCNSRSELANWCCRSNLLNRWVQPAKHDLVSSCLLPLDRQKQVHSSRGGALIHVAQRLCSALGCGRGLMHLCSGRTSRRQSRSLTGINRILPVPSLGS